MAPIRGSRTRRERRRWTWPRATTPPPRSAVEVDLAVRARLGLSAVDEVQALDRRPAQASDELHARGLRAQVEQALLGVEPELHGGGHLVGAHGVDRLGVR